ncbi:DUF262 domain-containing protein [Mycobacteroides abscessus subsp. massiliense]|uniref:DUF262 domain-containing protein n=1 Tax=Mycobacteroides abscessus TaxID=36809 RepID=UPI00266D7A06|nr:DUF262 domain-containing protein [Mycobacteroides abscessus]MDO3299427.1 DUF262 domain-containing protein [Mycobacteroides abscessus subsp. massiliense]
MATAAVDPSEQRAQLREQRLKVDFDTYDVTVDELVRRVGAGRIEIAPAYQRQFRWDGDRQSRLIESLLLGIPVPSLFMATNTRPDTSTTWEVVDGLQRLLSLVNFLGSTEVREAARLPDVPIRLTGLQKLTTFEGFRASKLPSDIVTGLLDRPIKVIVLNDKSDLRVRFDLFERLNTGGIRLTDQEVRGSVFMGEFIDLLDALAEWPEFKQVIHLPPLQQQDGTAQEYALRFFAFAERYQSFNHSVRDFLNDFCADAAAKPQIERRRQIFERTFHFLSLCFPGGLKSRKGTTPVNLFEGVAVGAHFALEQNPQLAPPIDLEWIRSDAIKSVTTGATNSRSKVASRIELARDHFLAGR